MIIGKIPSIIDTGTGFNSGEVIEIIKKFTEPSTIKQIILTHEHFDHVGGTLYILEATNENAQILAHKNAVGKLEKGKGTILLFFFFSP